VQPIERQQRGAIDAPSGLEPLAHGTAHAARHLRLGKPARDRFDVGFEGDDVVMEAFAGRCASQRRTVPTDLERHAAIHAESRERIAQGDHRFRRRLGRDEGRAEIRERQRDEAPAGETARHLGNRQPGEEATVLRRDAACLDRVSVRIAQER
jgi:hypothetical protein